MLKQMWEKLGAYTVSAGAGAERAINVRNEWGGFSRHASAEAPASVASAASSRQIVAKGALVASVRPSGPRTSKPTVPPSPLRITRAATFIRPPQLPVA